MFGKESKALFPSEEAPNLAQTVFEIPGMSKKMDIQGEEGLLMLVGEARTFGLDYAVLPNEQAQGLDDVLSCKPRWIDTVITGNTWTIVRFQNL
ncbi:MAG: hypothetical protein R3B47_16835 [Bacteroidia bacterium]